MAKKRSKASKTSSVDPNSIWQLYNRLKARDGSLQASYDSIYRDMGLDDSNPVYTYYKTIQNRERLWWEKEHGDEEDDPSVSVNLMHQMVQDQISYLGAERSVRCPDPIGLYPDEPSAELEALLGPEQVGAGGLPAPGASPEVSPEDAGSMPLPDVADTEEELTAQGYSDLLERGTLHLYREWHMKRQYTLMGWYSVVLGNAIGVLSWSKQRSLPLFKIRSPRGFYAQPDVDDDTRVSQAIFAQEMMGPSLALTYPELAERLEELETAWVIDYYDANVRLRLVEGIDTPLIDEDNPVGQVPIYIFPGILMPGLYGASALQLAIPIHREIQRLYSMEAELLLDAVRAPTVVNDPINVPKGWFWGQDATIEVGAQGKVGKAVLDVVDHGLLDKRIQDMKGNLRNAFDFAAMASGDYQGASITGKGVTNIMSHPELRLTMRVGTQNEVFETATSDALLLWQKYGKPGGIFGQKDGSDFSQFFNPKKINPMWTKIQVYVDSASFVDRQAAQVENLQKVKGEPGTRLMSKRRFLELDPDCPNVEAELRRIDKEDEDSLQKQLDFQAKLKEQEAAGQAPPGPIQMPPEGAPGPAPEGAGPTALGPGAGAGAAPPEVIPQEGAPAPQDEAQATIVALKEHFQGIANIHGEVWLTDLTAEGDISMGIHVYVTDKTDKQTIINSFANDELMAQIVDQKEVDAGRGIIFVSRKTPGAINVTPGAVDEQLPPEGEGRSPEPDFGPEGPPPEEGAAPTGGAAPELTPDMMAQLGSLMGGA